MNAATPRLTSSSQQSEGSVAAPLWLAGAIVLILSAFFAAFQDTPKCSSQVQPSSKPVTVRNVNVSGASSPVRSLADVIPLPVRTSSTKAQPVSRPLPSSATASAPPVSPSRYYDYNYRPPVGQHYVQGYYRRDGTYVSGHYKTNPDDSFWNNWSSQGNVNPYTGRVGTKEPRSGSSNSAGTYVNGYYRSNGTYVSGYYRRR